jgi:hypothetical protein
LRKNEERYNKKHVENKAKSILDEEPQKSQDFIPVFNRVKFNKLSFPNDVVKNGNISSNNNSNFNSHMTGNQKTEETNNLSKLDNKSTKNENTNISTNKLIKDVSKVIQGQFVSQPNYIKSKGSAVITKNNKIPKIPRPDNNLLKSRESAKFSFKRRSQSADNHSEKYENLSHNTNKTNLKKESTFDESEIVTIKSGRKSVDKNEKLPKENSIKETPHERISSAFEISQFIGSNNNKTMERNFDFSIESHKFAKIVQQTNDKHLRTGAGSLMESSLLYPIVERNVEFYIEEETLSRNNKIQEHINNINQESLQSLNNIEVFSNNNEEEINKLAESTINIVETSALNIKQTEENNKENFSIHYNSSLCNNTNQVVVTNSYAHNVTTKYDQSLINAIIKNCANEKEELKKRLNFFSNENTIKKEGFMKFSQRVDTVDSKINEKERNFKDPFIEVKAIHFSLIPRNSNEDLENELKDFVPKILNKQFSKKINFNTNLYRNNCRPTSTPNKLKKPHKNRNSRSFEKLTPQNKSKLRLNKTDDNSNQENINKKQINKTNSLNSIDNYAQKYERASAYLKKETRKFSQEFRETPIKKGGESKKVEEIKDKRLSQKNIHRKPTDEAKTQKNNKDHVKRIKNEEKKVISKTPTKYKKEVENKIHQEIVEKRSPVYRKEINKNRKNNIKMRGNSNVNVIVMSK